MRKHGTTWDRNFDYTNDADNLVTGPADRSSMRAYTTR